MLLEISGEITPERIKRQSQSKDNTQLWMWLVMEVKFDDVKRNIAWEPGMLGPWIKTNWKWSNRDGKSEPWHFRNQWTKMDWNGQQSLRRNGVALIVSKRVQNAVLGCTLKNHRMISVHFQGKPFNVTLIQVYAPTSNAEEAEVEQFYEDLQDLLELTPKTDVLFIIGTGMQN